MRKFTIFILFLLFAGFIFPEKIVPFPDLAIPQEIIIDQNQIFITEFPQVYIYSLNDFKLITKFGRAGEGPQEFFQFVRVRINPDSPEYILVGSQMRMSFFTREGKFFKEIRLEVNTRGRRIFEPLGKRYAMYGSYEENKIMYRTVDLYDETLNNKIKQVTMWKLILQQTRPINFTDRDLQGGEFTTYDKKIFVLLREKGDVDVFDDDGKKLFSINYDYERVPVTKEDEMEIRNFFQKTPGRRQFYESVKQQLFFPTYFPVARQLTIADNKIYVLTNKKEKGKSEFVIFDIKGKFLKKIMVPFKNMDPHESYPFTIFDGKIFQFMENEKTEKWELQINEI